MRQSVVRRSYDDFNEWLALRAAGSAAAGAKPLSRYRFIDGGTTANGETGAISEPFTTIQKFLTATGAPSSVADSGAAFVGVVTPSAAGYHEALAFPAARNLVLTTSGIQQVAGAIFGNATWNNAPNANQAALASVELQNLVLVGNFTVTDAVGSSQSAVIISDDDLVGGAILDGVFDSSACNHFTSLNGYGAGFLGNINLGSSASSGIINCITTNFESGITITAGEGIFVNCNMNVSAITMHTFATFTGCTFSIGENPLLTTGTGTGNANIFDGPSWRSFITAGGTRASGVIVLVVGGFYAGPVYGAALPTGAGPTTVSLNGNGASAGYTGSNSGNVYVSSGLQANAVVQVGSGGGENPGDTLCITKTDLAAHTLTVENNAGTTIGVIPAGGRGSIVLVKAGATAIGGITNDWALSNCGSLAA